MKKIILSVVCMLGTFTANAEEPIKSQVIMTDCGTVYKVPVNLSATDVADAIDKYSKADCK